MRSKLFVPGTRPDLFAKALTGEADAISVDLEDSVVGTRKDEAREYVSALLRSSELSSRSKLTGSKLTGSKLTGSKLMIVRCNAVGTSLFDADVQAVAQPALDILNLPKIETVAEVHMAVEALERAEACNGVSEPIGILGTIESPAGLRHAARIATADSRIVGLQLGVNDFFDSLGINRADVASVHATMFALRMAAGEAGVMAVDGAFPDFEDDRGFREEAVMARRLGYCGKSCIHPRQVAVANEIFMPHDAELAEARRLLEAWHKARAEGAGAFALDGKMIDRPAILRAEAVVAACRAGRYRT